MRDKEQNLIKITRNNHSRRANIQQQYCAVHLFRGDETRVIGVRCVRTRKQGKFCAHLRSWCRLSRHHHQFNGRVRHNIGHQFIDTWAFHPDLKAARQPERCRRFTYDLE